MDDVITGFPGISVTLDLYRRKFNAEKKLNIFLRTVTVLEIESYITSPHGQKPTR